MKGDGGRNGSEEKGRAEKETPATGESSEGRMEDSWQREPSRLGLGAAGLLGTALDTGTQDRPGREQGPRAEGEEGSRGPRSNPGRVHTQEGEKNPRSKNMASPLGGFLTNILPCHPTASQPQTKTRASKAAQKVAGWREQGRVKDRTGEQTDRQTDRDVPASISRGPSFPDTHVIISTESDGTEGSVCCGLGWEGGAGRNHPILG